MTYLKPIQTEYSGYLFRSRLEARWAVFFDYLSVEYDYEIEGYELEEQGRYLPDFWLPQFKCFLEIKRKDDPENLYPKFVRFSEGVGPIIHFKGNPSLSWNGTLYCQDTTESSGGSYQTDIGFAWCNKCSTFTLSFSDEDSRLLGGRRTLHNSDWSVWKTCCDPEHRNFHSIGELEEAITAAKQARFEFGKKG